MTDAQRDAALDEEAGEYAESKVRAGIWSRAESLKRSQEEIRGFVGAHPSDRGHEFFVGLDAEGRRIGWLWLGPVPSPGASPDARWLFQVVVDLARRGHGYGRGLLQAAEEHLRASGRTEIALNVFRWNTVAVALYTSSGYEIASQDDKAIEMRKRLPPS
jgi:GNAT superfamily N-acetyltransferase